MQELLRSARQLLTANVQNLTLEEALFSDGGHRSILGVLKHIGGWAHVYRSYAFDDAPKHWEQTAWPRRMRETVELTQDYLDEVIAWIDEAMAAWDNALDGVETKQFMEPHRVHWGGTAPLRDIVVMVSQHLVYHAGELNMLLSIAREEAWEVGEEVEENHIDTFGHGIRGPWMSDEIYATTVERLRAARQARRSQ